MKYETTNSQMNASAAERMYAAIGGGQIGGSLADCYPPAEQADVGMSAEMEPAPDTDLEALVNRSEMTIVGLSDLEGRLHHLFGKLTGSNVAGEKAETTKDRRGGLIGRGNDHMDRVDSLLISCIGLVSRLSGLI